MQETKQIRFPQLAKLPLIVSTKAPNLNNRLWAKTLDFSLVFVACTVAHWLWAPVLIPVAVVLWGRIERTGRGQSPGKWLLGLHTIEAPRGLRPSFYSSLVRNIPFLLMSVGLLWDSAMGWALVALGFAAASLECYFVVKLSTGVRVGDIVASTRVFDYKDEHTLFIERFLKEEQA